jgi:hypothetical protein
MQEAPRCFSKGPEKRVHFGLGVVTRLVLCQLVHSMEQTSSSESRGRTATKNIPSFIEPETSLPRSQEPTNDHYDEPVKSN